jgi:hypothetical protein
MIIRACSTHSQNDKMYKKYEGKRSLGNIRQDMKIILKCIVKLFSAGIIYIRRQRSNYFLAKHNNAILLRIVKKFCKTGLYFTLQILFLHYIVLCFVRSLVLRVQWLHCKDCDSVLSASPCFKEQGSARDNFYYISTHL